MNQVVNYIIDTSQGIKTNLVKAFVLNEEVKKPIQTYIDAEASYLKKLSQDTVSFLTAVGVASMQFDAAKAFATK